MFYFSRKKKGNNALIRGDYFRFGSVWFFRTKTGSNRFGSVFSVWLGFLPV
jgi:hypothetical protein